jgi:hypothetical protein
MISAASVVVRCIRRAHNCVERALNFGTYGRARPAKWLSVLRFSVVRMGSSVRFGGGCNKPLTSGNARQSSFRAAWVTPSRFRMRSECRFPGRSVSSF